MLAFNQVDITAGEKNLFKINSLQLDAGIYALVGRNGAGKSTFLKTIMGLHNQFNGEILLENKPIHNYSKAELAKRVAYVPSKTTIFGNHTGWDVLMLGRLPYQNVFAKSSQSDRNRINEILDLLVINDLADKQFGLMSDGEKQMILIGRALVQETKLILLDEPAAFLDVVNKVKLNQIIAKIASEQNCTIVYSTHDIMRIHQHASYVLLITDKELKKLAQPKLFEETILKSFGLIDEGL